MMRPYRQCPPDFRQRFVELGWELIGEHYRTNWRVVRRWIAETGREDLTAARQTFVRQRGPRFLHMEPMEARHLTRA